MSKRNRRSNRKPWDHCEEVVHNPDGSWHGKLRWPIEHAKEFLAKQSTFGLKEDEKGYYTITGELVMHAD